MAHWSEVHIAGHRCRAFTPSAVPGAGALIYLHAEDERAPVEMWPGLARRLEQSGLSCLAPMAGRSWWTDRIWAPFDETTSAERFLVQSVVPWIEDHWKPSPPTAALLGVGMGGQGALKLAYKHPHLFPVCAAVAPSIDYHRDMEAGDATLNKLYRDAEQARQDTATLHIHPLNWPRHQWFCSDPADYVRYDGADRLRMKLYSLGVPYESDLETSAGGDLERYVDLMAGSAMRFLAERLERERMRVP
jgi:pimeloyl-ACP methyl ester carboxylesterase